eukprot:g9921.t1
MESADNDGNQLRGQDSAGVRPSSSAAAAAVGSNTVACSEMEALSESVPAFLDRTFKMIEQVPDDIVCWSRAGDSFIIKQVLPFEEVLPAFFNHKKFMSFVRQLNFYGFRKIKGSTSSRSKSGDGATHCRAAATPNGPQSWEEYTHPQFRRGRPDLLVDIMRKKDSGRSKRKRAESLQSGILGTLVTDVGTVSSDLKAVNNRLDEMMSLLLGIAGSQNQAASANPRAQSEGDMNRYAPVVVGGGGVSGITGGDGGLANTALSSAASTPAATARGGFGGRGEVGGSGSGVPLQGGHHPCAHGAPVGYCVAPLFPTDHRQQRWPDHAILPQPTKQPCPTIQFSALPHHLHAAQGGAIPTTPASKPSAAARAPQSMPVRGSSNGQQLQLPPAAVVLQHSVMQRAQPGWNGHKLV